MAKEKRNWLVYRIHDEALRAAARRHARGRLLDIGCGVKPYSDLLRPLVTEHVGLEHEGTDKGLEHADLVGSAYNIPAPDASFDTAIATAVLEHLEEPETALRECRRVLRPGGIALYTVPLLWHLHEEPRDFYRFTRHGLQYQFRKAGFEVLEIVPLSGFLVTFAQLWVYYLYRFNRGPFRALRVIDGLAWLVQSVAWRLRRLDRSHEWTWMYLVVARRPVEAAG